MSDGAQMLERLRCHRPHLLAMEAIGWLHMTGKAHPDFLRSQGGQKTEYDYQRWHERENPPFDWDDLLSWVKSTCNSSKQIEWPGSFTEFVTKHAGSGSAGVLGLFQAAHGITSGIEKNLPKSTSDYLKQDVTHMWLASPFGHPMRNLLADPPELLAEEGWKSLIAEISRMLEDLKKFGASGTASVEDWWDWREPAIGPQSFLRRAFSSTLAETRLPNNDVTLWDQSYITAALFKSALAGAILTADTFPWNDGEVKSNTQWRVLTIGFGTRHYEARAVKIGDWTGARGGIETFFQCVRRLIEVDLAVGSLVYRDDECLAFTFPGLHANTAGLDDKSADQLKGAIAKEVDSLAQKEQFETPPLCQLSGSTRSFVPMLSELQKARKQLAVPVHRPWTVCEAGGAAATEAQHVCPVCLVRRNEPPEGVATDTDNARKSLPCSVCRERRPGRLVAWLSGDEDTIWISEVADGNDRVALLTLSLGLDPWLGGGHVDSLRAQSIAEWRRFNPVLKNTPNPIDPSAPFQKLVDYVRSKLPKFDKKDPVLASLQEGYQHEKCWEPFFKKIVEDRSNAPKWKGLDDIQRAHWLVHQLFRKLPSPGRIYRFWRTAETFFDDLLKRFQEIASAHENRWRTRRLCFKPADDVWENRETYLGSWRNEPFEVLYLEDQKAFVTISNLARCFRPWEKIEALEQETQPIMVKGDDGRQRELRAKPVSTPEKIGCYAPVIPLDLSPQRFRVLVPLDRATACLEAAIAKWQEEFARVWDRMPLRIGVVAFPRLTPFQAVIEAARNLEEALDQNGTETWWVIGCCHRDGTTALSLQHARGQECVALLCKLPDGRDDVFYPYLRVQARDLRFPHDFRHPEGKVFRHVNDLLPGDGIEVDASRIAAVFLDTTARRFEPPEVRPLGEFARMRAVWEQLTRWSPSLSALRGAWSELEDRAQTWRDAHGRWLPGAEAQWRGLAGAILQDRLGVSGAAREALVEAAASGTLAWALTWHLTWLKESLGGAPK
jgi:CRISPR-associated Csx11 family protein